MAYYISFLKTLSLKLNSHTVHFFYNEVRPETGGQGSEEHGGSFSLCQLSLCLSITKRKEGTDEILEGENQGRDRTDDYN